ncbi:hypothetical protein QMO56_06120 [Roseomonas sp. E05]|nr:hypothetical protein [Roseomonas sp. E05]MDJ0387682.1 hypothetical protein [Roseomonas sp. E05]
MRAVLSKPAGTSAARSARLAPLATVMAFSPAALTVMKAHPVG